MRDTAKKAVGAHRERMKRQLLVRIEVRVHKEDAALLRRVARALSDPERGNQARVLLRERFALPEGKGLKPLLASAPLDGIDLDGNRDMGRAIEL